jgi:ferredoxin
VKVRVDSKLCTGHGRCYALAPDVFLDDEEGRCVIEIEKVPPELENQARLGAANCPEGAIQVEED